MEVLLLKKFSNAKKELGIFMKIKNILISQPKPEFGISPFQIIADKYKIKVDFNPFVKIKRIPVEEFLESKVNVKNYTSLIFYSKIAIDVFFETLNDLKIKPNENWKYFCMYPSLANYLQKYIICRKRKVFSSENGTVNGLRNTLIKHPEEKFLIILSEVHKQDIPKIMEEENLHYGKALLFRAISANMSNLNIDDYEIFLFFSPAGILSLKENFNTFNQENKVIGTLGENTYKMAIECGFNVDIKAPNSKFPSLQDALDDFIKKNIN